MSHRGEAVPLIERVIRGDVIDVGFISPILSAALAARAASSSLADRVHIAPPADTYARTIGLEAALRSQAPAELPTSGRSYSGLARLDAPAHVEHASQIVNDFVYAQLASHAALAGHIARVVGELHDNVASHASGVGVSAAQLFHKGMSLEMAIADNGCGMLRNVRRRRPDIADDVAAISWCLQRGNTTGAIDDDMAQFLPPDALFNPYPSTVSTRSKENNHLGEGLWQLSELVRVTNGSLFVWSGEGAVVVEGGRQQTMKLAPWRGVLIELTLPIVDAGGGGGAVPDSELEALAGRLGL